MDVWVGDCRYFGIQEGAKRLALPAMTASQRKVVHVVCNLCRVVRQAYGAEPFRCVHLMKNPLGAETPVKSLSEVAKARLQVRKRLVHTLCTMMMTRITISISVSLNGRRI